MDAFDENYWTISIYLIVVVAIGTIVGNVITALFGLLYKSISCMYVFFRVASLLTLSLHQRHHTHLYLSGIPACVPDLQ
jgi:hypothetical protein